MTAMFVNLPVTDLERAKAFYTAIGGTINPQFTDHNAACVVVEDGHNYFMLLVREFFQTFTELPIGDPAVSPSAATAIFLDSREAVDVAVAAGLAALGDDRVGAGRLEGHRLRHRRRRADHEHPPRERSHRRLRQQAEGKAEDSRAGFEHRRELGVEG